MLFTTSLFVWCLTITLTVLVYKFRHGAAIDNIFSSQVISLKRNKNENRSFYSEADCCNCNPVVVQMSGNWYLQKTTLQAVGGFLSN